MIFKVAQTATRIINRGCGFRRSSFIPSVRSRAMEDHRCTPRRPLVEGVGLDLLGEKLNLNLAGRSRAHAERCTLTEYRGQRESPDAEYGGQPPALVLASVRTSTIPKMRKFQRRGR